MLFTLLLALIALQRVIWCGNMYYYTASLAGSKDSMATGRPFPICIRGVPDVPATSKSAPLPPSLFRPFASKADVFMVDLVLMLEQPIPRLTKRNAWWHKWMAWLHGSRYEERQTRKRQHERRFHSDHAAMELQPVTLIGSRQMTKPRASEFEWIHDVVIESWKNHGDWNDPGRRRRRYFIAICLRSASALSSTISSKKITKAVGIQMYPPKCTLTEPFVLEDTTKDQRRWPLFKHVYIDHFITPAFHSHVYAVPRRREFQIHLWCHQVPNHAQLRLRMYRTSSRIWQRWFFRGRRVAERVYKGGCDGDHAFMFPLPSGISTSRMYRLTAEISLYENPGLFQSKFRRIAESGRFFISASKPPV